MSPHLRAVYDGNTPARFALSKLAHKWTVLVVCTLAEGPRHFAELRREIGGISHKVLSEALRTLERDGFVRRRVVSGRSRGVIYSITPLGRSLHLPLRSLWRWAERRTRDVEQARARYDGATTSARP
ncbi:MAG TPA: helix-turn-helix domain-containing protein [Gemmatimonadales bacterium]|nr:helix-turn-helix domain-containing protein [Gemmatimonadales bacterium]